jgi:hypothetical protein
MKMEWAGRIACMGRRQMHIRAQVGNTEGKRPAGRPRRGCKDFRVELEITKMGWYGLD